MKETTAGHQTADRIEYWREQVAQQERSGLSVKQFCERTRLPSNALRLAKAPAEAIPDRDSSRGVAQEPEDRAVRYVLKNWKALPRYAQDGYLEIDNSATERSIRGVAVGRCNWLFFGSDVGGKTAAVLRSFVASCERVNIDSFAWFKDILSRIPSHPINRIAELLPHNWAST